MLLTRRFDSAVYASKRPATPVVDPAVQLQPHKDLNSSAGFVRFRLYTCGEVVQTVPRATGSCLAPQKGGSADGEEKGPRQEGVPGQEVTRQEGPREEEVASTGVILRFPAARAGRPVSFCRVSKRPRKAGPPTKRDIGTAFDRLSIRFGFCDALRTR